MKTDEELIGDFERAQAAWNALNLSSEYGLRPRDAAKIEEVGDEVVVSGLLVIRRFRGLDDDAIDLIAMGESRAEPGENVPWDSLKAELEGAAAFGAATAPGQTLTSEPCPTWGPLLVGFIVGSMSMLAFVSWNSTTCPP